MSRFTRVILIVLDGAGCGELPDAAAYGDSGSNTLRHVATRVPLRIPHLRALGLAHVLGLAPPGAGCAGAWGRMAEASPGKDSVTGHWELMGIILDRPFPTFPGGFPAEAVAELERRIGRRTLGNIVASGTAILDALGPDHLRTGAPIVYTSADSVCQIAAHEDLVPVPELYAICEQAFDVMSNGLGVGRVIARPFVGEPGGFRRTANRHDFARAPHGETLLDRLTSAGVPVAGIGKVYDLFAGRGVPVSESTASDEEGVARVLERMHGASEGLIFANLVDFDTVYGHRNDVIGYAENLERFDEGLGRILAALRADDLLVVTADHGNDPTTPSTDHSREYVPLLVSGARVRAGHALGTRATFADLAQTLAGVFGVGALPHGTSFLEDIVVDHP